MYLIGYDIGSSTIKTAIIDAQTQAIVKVLQYPDQDMDLISRQIGWAEQQPEIWWNYLCVSTRKLLSETKIDPKEIIGIGLAYQMHGLVMVDKEQEVLRPSIIWCDSRASTIGQEAFKELGEEYCLRNFLNSPGNFTASKLKWVMDNEPEIYERTHRIMLPGDFLNMKFSGQISTSISGLSESILWDYKNKKVSDEILDYFKIDSQLIPEIKPIFSNIGEVCRSASIQSGLKEGTPIFYRAGDQPNNALSLNVLNKGEVAATSGTSGVVYGVTENPICDPKSRVNVFTHVNYEENFDRLGALLCINGAGIQYSWIKNQIARSNSNYFDMDRMAASVPIGSEGICILPFGNGSERVFEDRNIGSHIFNLRFNRHTRAHIYRSALEGVAFAFVYGIQLLKDMGLAVDVIRVGNDNMFQSRIFSKTIATLLNIHIEVVDTTGAVGAALAAGIAAGKYNNLKEALGKVKPSKMYEPNLDRVGCLQAYSYWKASLNQVLKGQLEEPQTKSSGQLNAHLKRELRNKNSKLSAQALTLASQTKILSQIESTIKTMNAMMDKGELEKQIQSIKAKLENVNLNQNSFEDFQFHYDQMNQDFIKKITTTYPNLSAEDIKLLIYLKLKLKSKEIGEKMNLSVRGVETKRYRLKKKLNLSKNIKLDEFFDTI